MKIKNRKYIATREIFVPASHRKNSSHFIRIKKGRVIETQLIDGKEVIEGTTTRVYYYLKTGALVRGTKLNAKHSDKPRTKKPFNRNNKQRKDFKKQPRNE